MIGDESRIQRSRRPVAGSRSEFNLAAAWFVRRPGNDSRRSRDGAHSNTGGVQDKSGNFSRRHSLHAVAIDTGDNEVVPRTVGQILQRVARNFPDADGLRVTATGSSELDFVSCQRAARDRIPADEQRAGKRALRK